MLQAKNVSLTLHKDNRLLIEDFSFSLERGDRAVIIGEEGNGKSTLLKYLCDEQLAASYASGTGTVIRRAPADFGGTAVSVSHDRSYLDEVAHTVYVLSEDGLAPL